MADTSFGRKGLLGGLLIVGALGASLSYGITEEIKFGRAEGSVVMERNGKPLPNARVILQPTFDLPDKVRFRPSVKTDENGQFKATGLPVGEYEVQVYGKAHSLYGGVLKVEEGKISTAAYKAELTSPQLSVYVSQKVLLPGEESRYEVTGVSENPDLAIELYRMDMSLLAKFGSPYDLVRSVAGTRQQKNPLSYPGLKLVDSHTKTLESQDVEGYFAEAKALPSLDKGVYLLAVREGKNQQFAWLNVTDMALVTKQAGRDTLVFATHLKTGKPLPGVDLTLHINGQSLPQGKTDAKGVARFVRPKVAANNSNFVVAGSLKGSNAHVWTGGWDGDAENPASVFVKTDRPIYRPGDEIQFKGTVRVQQGLNLETPAGQPIEVTIKDPDEETISTVNLPLNGFGSFAGNFKTDLLGTPGTYRIQTKFKGQEQSSYIEVIPFRKPEYTVTVTPTKKAFSRGEEIEMKVKAEYYTGEPLAGGAVNVTVNRAWLWAGDPFDEYYDPMSSDWNSGDYLGSVEARTNGNGEAIVRFRPPAEEIREADVQDAKITFEASVADPSERFFSGKGSALVARGLINVQAEANSWIGERDQPNTVKVKIFDQEKQTLVPDKEFQATFRRVRWIENPREKGVYEEKETILNSVKGTTDHTGEADVTFTPNQEGDYMVLIESSDRNGRRVAAEARFWVYGAGMSEPISDDSLKLVVAKREFAPNERVTGVIQVAKPGGSLLLTVEGSKLVKAQVINMDSAVKPFDLGPMSEIAPGARIKATRVFEKTYQEDDAGFKVSLKNKEVNLTIKPSKPETKPGETVTYTIRATDNEGQPVRAELSVGVVDEGIYAIREDDDGPLPFYYQPRWSSVSTSYSFPEVYLDGEDKAPKNLQIRKSFVDTAYWAPTVPTDSDGTAKVTVKMPDNLTEWRTTVTALTSDSKFGQAKMGLISKKDLMVRLSTPAFMVQEDEQKLGAVISNTTGQEQKVQVKLEAAGLSFTGDAQKEYSIPANGSQRVDWTLKASELGTGTLTVKAWASSSLSDGLELKVPVRAKGVRTVASESGEVAGTWDKSLSLEPQGVEASLRVRVDPHPFSVIAASLPGMVDFPYGCVEQTLSRFVPALAVQNAMSLNGLISEETRLKIPKVTAESLKRLKKMQHSDGGWGWWEYDKTSTLMTAAVLEGLYRARENGATIDASMLEKALNWSRERLKGPAALAFDENTTYLAYAVMLFGPDEAARLKHDEASGKAMNKEKVKLYSNEEVEWPVDDIARMAIAEQMLSERTGDPGRSDKAKTLLRMAIDRVQKGSGGWGEIFWGETKGRLLMAIAAVEPDIESAPEYMRLILMDRQAFAWGGTRETALIVLGALDLIKERGLTSLNGSVAIKVNGEEVGTMAISPQNLKPFDITIPESKLKQGGNSVSVVAEGLTPYAQAVMVQTLTDDTLAAKDGEGLSLERAYYRMTAKTLENGTVVREQETTPRTSFKSGEIFRSKLTIKSDKVLNYLLIEDPIASHTNIVDSEDPYSFGDWSFWWDRSSYYSDKGVFFKRSLDAGVHSFSYSMRAESPGKSTSLPAMVTLFYQPKVTARSSGITLEVTP